MAQIKRISFDSVDANSGCQCDKCGQWIKNIWTVNYTDGLTIHFGIDCFEKTCKDSRLNDYGMKLMKKTLKKIEDWTKRRDDFEKNAEIGKNDYGFSYDSKNPQSFWFGKTFEEYKAWMLEKWFPARFADCEKELARFSKINFQR